MSYRVLLVEDEPNLGGVLQGFLQLNGLEVTWRKDGETGYSTFCEQSFDALLIDVMMPKMNGFELAELVRQKNEVVPLVFLTARDAKVDVLKGYELGADDYITKPFDSDVLLAKIHVLCKRMAAKSDYREFQFGQFHFRESDRMLTWPTGQKQLSPKEGMLMGLLAEKYNQVLTRDAALKEIWGERSYFTTRSMDVYITKLRKYLQADSSLQIVNLHSMGYMLKDV